MVTGHQLLLNRRLQLYIEAEERILQGQSYTIGNRTLTRANLAEVRAAIDDHLAQGATLDGVSGRVRRTKRIVFVD